MTAPTGIDNDSLVMVDGLYNTKQVWRASQVRYTVSALEEIAGVRSASAAFGLPMVPSAQLNMMLVAPSGIKANVAGYAGEGLVKTLGLHIIEGRDFLPDEYSDWGVGAGLAPKRAVEPIIITRSLENRLFNGLPSVGRLLKLSSDVRPTTYVVVGVVSHLQRNEVDLSNDGLRDNTILLSRRIGDTRFLNFAVRLDSEADHPAVLKKISGVIKNQLYVGGETAQGMRVLSYLERRDATFASFRSALTLLITVTLAVMAVTLIGIGGMSGFWVQMRKKHFAIRRALGARRADVLLLVLVENLIIVGSAAVVGMFLAEIANAFLMRNYELPRLPFHYLPLGAIVAIFVGQVAAIGPALKATKVSPSSASRSG